jgi:hypothetical protein
MNLALFFFNRYARPIAYLLTGAGDGVEYSGFTGVGISG